MRAISPFVMAGAFGIVAFRIADLYCLYSARSVMLLCSHMALKWTLIIHIVHLLGLQVAI